MKRVLLSIGLITSFLSVGIEGCGKKPGQKTSKTEKKVARGSKKQGRSKSPKKKAESKKGAPKSKAKVKHRGPKQHAPQHNAALQQAQAQQLAQQLQSNQAAHNAAQQAHALQVAQLMAAHQAAQAEAARQAQEKEDAELRAAQEASLNTASQQAHALQVAQLMGARQAADIEADRQAQEKEDAEIKAAQEASLNTASQQAHALQVAQLMAARQAADIEADRQAQEKEDAEIKAAEEASLKEMLQQHINYLEQGIIQLTQDLAQVQQARSTLDKNMETLEETLIAGAGNLDQLQEALNQAQVSLANYQQQNDQAQARIQELTQQLRTSQQKSTQDQERLLKQIQELQNALHQAQKERADLERKFANLLAEYESRGKAQDEAKVLDKELAEVLGQVNLLEIELQELEALDNLNKAQSHLGALAKQKQTIEEHLKSIYALLDTTSIEQSTKQEFALGIEQLLGHLIELDSRIAKLRDPHTLEQHKDNAQIKELEGWLKSELNELTKKNTILSKHQGEIATLLLEKQIKAEAAEKALLDLHDERSKIAKDLKDLKESKNFKELQGMMPNNQSIARAHAFHIAGGSDDAFNAFEIVTDYNIQQLKGADQGKMEESKADASAPSILTVSGDEIKAAITLDHIGSPILTVGDISFNAKSNEMNFVQALACLSDSTLTTLGINLAQLVQEKEALLAPYYSKNKPIQILRASILSMLTRLHDITSADQHIQEKIKKLIQPLKELKTL